jgi:adenylate kinase
LDGYPRNLEQSNFLGNIGDLNVMPIYFHLDKNLLLERINNRIQCKSCSKVYNAKLFNSDAFYCDFCGDIECYKRSDDNINALNNRIIQFEINTLPVIDFYQKLGVLHTINASSNIEQIKCEVNLLITKSGIDF